MSQQKTRASHLACTHTIKLLAVSTNEEGSALKGCTRNAEFGDLGNV